MRDRPIGDYCTKEMTKYAICMIGILVNTKEYITGVAETQILTIR